MVDSADAMVEPPGAGPLSESAPLAQLPRPVRRARTLTLVLMAVTALLAGALAWQLRGEALYALNPSTAVALGALADVELSAAHNNTYVRATVTVAPTPSVRFRRLLDHDDYHVALAAQRQGAHRWLAYRVPTTIAAARFVPPSLVAGRLVRVDELGARYRGLRAALERASGVGEARSWVLVDGQDPQGAGWQLALVLLLLMAVGWNLLAMVRILRKPRSRVARAGDDRPAVES